MSPADRVPVSLIVDERLRTTSICLGVAYGSRHDSVNQGGLAHVLEHLLMSAPAANGEPLVQFIERLGGSANAETGLEHMLFYAQVDAQDADVVVESMLSGVLAPELDPVVLESERAAVIQELAAAAADPADVVQDAFLAALFPGHPLGRPVGGTVEEVRALGLEAVGEGHRSAFSTSPMALAVVGPSIPRGLSGRQAAPSGATRTRGPVPLGPVRVTTPAWPDEFGWVAVGGRSTRLGDPARHRFTVLANLFGGHASSLLYRKLRVEAGIAYSFESWDRGYTEAGAWRVLIGVDSGNGGQAVDIVIRELEGLAATGPSDADLDAARRQARMSLILDTETPLEHARSLALHAVRSPEPWNLQSELDRIAAVEKRDIQQAAAEVLSDLITVVRPERP
ncbi:pitrilysin family protein [Streptomyces lavendulae]|uniref:M16 family metallopeptidase n=1 Tax=Streptomyces lavendulae TaxID=1914 RepID=UPI0033E686E4